MLIKILLNLKTPIILILYHSSSYTLNFSYKQKKKSEEPSSQLAPSYGLSYQKVYLVNYH